MKNTIIVVFERERTGQSFDIEVPLQITANDLIYALNEGLRLGINLEDISKCYLSCENPIALLRGNQTLEELGLRDGSRICFNQ